MYVRAKVWAGAREEAVQKAEDGRYEIFVREKAERGLANARVRQLLAREFGLPPESVRLVRGGQSPSKIFLLPDVV